MLKCQFYFFFVISLQEFDILEKFLFIKFHMQKQLKRWHSDIPIRIFFTLQLCNKLTSRELDLIAFIVTIAHSTIDFFT